MSSLNLHYTIKYSQPEDYHFSHDSVFLARQVFERPRINTKRVLDLCSGCGVVGLDYLYHLNEAKSGLPEKVDFLEVQDIYRPHFEKNLASLDTEVTCDYLALNYNQVFEVQKLKNNYDLILCNPPYFRADQGALSKSEFKNRCRFFLDSDFKTLMAAIEYLLTAQGEAFILIQDLIQHGINIEAELDACSENLRFQKLQKIRKTDLYLITKL
jgi:tRNA1Val (adenine37-N6)-methyltransferase